MTRRLIIWRKLLFPFEKLRSSREKGRLEKSWNGAFLGWHLRDSLRYYENGRSVTIWAELLARGKYQRMVARDPILKWDGNGKVLTQEEKQKVLRKFYGYFDQHKIRWVFSDEIEELSS
jgi:hypothetical protein